MSIRDYEAMVVVHPDLNEEGLSKFQGEWQEMVTRHGGRVLETIPLGKRKLSFRVGKVGEGLYLKARIQIPPLEVEGFQKAAGLMESIVRMMILKETRRSSAPTRSGPPNVQEESDGRL
jgi:ribosomal protein S6